MLLVFLSVLFGKCEAFEMAGGLSVLCDPANPAAQMIFRSGSFEYLLSCTTPVYLHVPVEQIPVFFAKLSALDDTQRGTLRSILQNVRICGHRPPIIAGQPVAVNQPITPDQQDLLWSSVGSWVVFDNCDMTQCIGAEDRPIIFFMRAQDGLFHQQNINFREDVFYDPQRLTLAEILHAQLRRSIDLIVPLDHANDFFDELRLLRDRITQPDLVDLVRKISEVIILGHDAAPQDQRSYTVTSGDIKCFPFWTLSLYGCDVRTRCDTNKSIQTLRVYGNGSNVIDDEFLQPFSGIGSVDFYGYERKPRTFDNIPTIRGKEVGIHTVEGNFTYCNGSMLTPEQKARQDAARRRQMAVEPAYGCTVA
jgi:hypothetical protein